MRGTRKNVCGRAWPCSRLAAKLMLVREERLAATAVLIQRPLRWQQVNKLDWLVWMASFLGTLFISIEIGLGISIGLALLIVIYESAFPHMALLGRIPGTGVYRNIKQYPKVRQCHVINGHRAQLC